MESPTTLRRKSSPCPTRDSGSGKTSSMCCSARIGPPAAIRPTNGMLTVFSGFMESASLGSVISKARPLEASLRIKPLSTRASIWYLTEAGEARPAAWPISRMDGG